MREDPSKLSIWPMEDLNTQDLFLSWKCITLALISTGHAAQLHRELDNACRTGSEEQVSDDQSAISYPFLTIHQDASRSVYLDYNDSCRQPALLSINSQATTINIKEKGRSASVFDHDEDRDIIMSSLDSSEDDDEIYRDFDLLNHPSTAKKVRYRASRKHLRESSNFCSTTDEEIDQRVRWFISMMSRCQPLEHPSAVDAPR